MNIKLWLCFIGIGAILTACPTPKPLDQQTQNQIRDFTPQAVASSTQFLKGAPVSLVNAIATVQQGAENNPKFQTMLASIPKNLSADFSKMQSQSSSKNLLIPTALNAALAKYNLKLQDGTNCGTNQALDNDGDGIPNNFNYTFDCSTTYGNYAASLTGNVSIKDSDDNNENSGYEMRFTDLTFLYTDTSKNYLIGLRTNSNTVVKTGSNGKYSVTQTFKFEGIEYKQNNLTYLKYTTNGVLEYMPIANATNFNRFSRGTLNFNVKFTFEVDSPNEKYTSELSMIANNMQVDQNSCGSNAMVNSGTVQIKDGKNTLTWTITGCGNGTWNYQ
jgi:hypothetical protein